jgi:hypothetical protein
MLIRIRRHATFSNIVALLALFFALGGTVYAAGKLSGKQIKPNSIPGNRVKKNSLTGSQLKETAIKGVASANGIARVTYQNSTPVAVDPNVNTAYTVTATCPSGQKAIGGGVSDSSPDNGFVQDFNFTPDHTGYTARVFSGTVASTFTATAVCVPVTATTP